MDPSIVPPLPPQRAISTGKIDNVFTTTNLDSGFPLAGQMLHLRCILLPFIKVDKKTQPELVSAPISKCSCYETVKPTAHRASGPLSQQ